MLHFDEKTHTYTDENGQQVPSVTTILKELGVSGDYSGIPNIEFYADRGTLTHYGIELLLSGVTGDMWAVMMAEKAEGLKASVKDVEGYIASFMKIAADFEPDDEGLEVRIHREVEGVGAYAGTIDFSGKYRGVRAKTDWKTSKQANRAYHLQVGGAYRDNPEERCIIVLLKEDGGEPTIIDTDEDAPEVWNELLKVYYSNMTAEEKSFAAKVFALGAVKLEEEDAAKVAPLRAEMKRLDAEKKKIEKQVEKIEDDIKLRLGGRPGSYSGADYELSFSPQAGKKTNDVDGFLAYLRRLGYDNLADEFANFEKTGEPFYKVEYKPKKVKKDAPAVADTADPYGINAPAPEKPSEIPAEKHIEPLNEHEKVLFDLIKERGLNITEELIKIRAKCGKELDQMSALEIVGICKDYRVEEKREHKPNPEMTTQEKYSIAEKRPGTAQLIATGAECGISKDKILAVAVKFGKFEGVSHILTVEEDDQMMKEISKIKPPQKRGPKKAKDAAAPLVDPNQPAVTDFTGGKEPEPFEDKTAKDPAGAIAMIKDTFTKRGFSDDDYKLFEMILARQFEHSLEASDENEIAYALSYASVVKRAELDSWRALIK